MIINKWSEFERGQTVGTRKMDASVTKVAKVFIIARNTASKIFRRYCSSGKTASAKSKRGRKCTLIECDSHSLNDENVCNEK